MCRGRRIVREDGAIHVAPLPPNGVIWRTVACAATVVEARNERGQAAHRAPPRELPGGPRIGAVAALPGVMED